jgi:hypothetical protein
VDGLCFSSFLSASWEGIVTEDFEGGVLTGRFPDHGGEDAIHQLLDLGLLIKGRITIGSIEEDHTVPQNILTERPIVTAT